MCVLCKLRRIFHWLHSLFHLLLRATSKQAIKLLLEINLLSKPAQFECIIPADMIAMDPSTFYLYRLCILEVALLKVEPVGIMYNRTVIVCFMNMHNRFPNNLYTVKLLISYLLCWDYLCTAVDGSMITSRARLLYLHNQLIRLVSQTDSEWLGNDGPNRNEEATGFERSASGRYRQIYSLTKLPPHLSLLFCLPFVLMKLRTTLGWEWPLNLNGFQWRNAIWGK